jgi:hypothetical protein
MIKIGNIELPDFPLLLAPMEVSDRLFVGCVNAWCWYDVLRVYFFEGLIRDAKSRMKLDIFDYERPVGIQILEVMKGNGLVF